MTYDSTTRLATVQPEPGSTERAERLRRFGVGAEFPDTRFDAFARRVAEVTSAPHAMVNFIDNKQQFFAGMFVRPESPDPNAEPVVADTASRIMPLQHGFCPHVLTRRKALVLEDVCDYPRYSGDSIMDEMGIRSYLGAPLMDDHGNPLGTVAVGDLEPRPWGHPGLRTIKDMAAQVMEELMSWDFRSRMR